MTTPRRQPASRHPRGFRAAMGLVETLVATLVIALLMAGLVVASNTLRTTGADQETRVTLRKLQGALAQRSAQHGPIAAETINDALRQIMDNPRVAPLMQGVDVHGERPAIRDGFGRPIVFLPQGPDGQATFASPGPDGLMGDPTSGSVRERRRAADNIYGTELEITP